MTTALLLGYTEPHFPERFIPKFKEFAQLTISMIEGLTCANWDQRACFYRVGKEPLRHCIGVHLGLFFQENQTEDQHGPLVPMGKSFIGFSDGRRGAANYVGCAEEELDALLCSVGSPIGPFSGSSWRNHPVAVWKNALSLHQPSSSVLHLERCLSLTHQTTH